MSENRVLRNNITGDQRKLHNEDPHSLYCT